MRAAMSGSPADPPPPVSSAESRRTRLKVLLAAALAIVAFLLSRQYGDELTLARLAEREQQIREYHQQHPLGVYAAAFVLYVAVTGLSIPGAALLSLAYGWYFGFWRGLALVSFASTAGACIAFLLSRYLLRDLVQRRFSDRLERFQQALDREGAFYLFSLRLIPVVPFFLINLVMGLTSMRLATFWWVSQLGMLAGTAVYVNAGASIPSAEQLAERGLSGILTPAAILSFALLGVFPLLVKRAMQRRRA